MNQRFIIELESGMWLARLPAESGLSLLRLSTEDPGRTLKKDHAREFTTRAAADAALQYARKTSGRPFVRARIMPAETTLQQN